MLRSLKTGQPIYSSSQSLDILLQTQSELVSANEELKATLDRVKDENHDLLSQITSQRVDREVM